MRNTDIERLSHCRSFCSVAIQCEGQDRYVSYGSAALHGELLTIVPPALVTGGGTGIGKAIASALVQNGAKVYIAARKEPQLKEVRASVCQAQFKC
jgi:predicted Rossmann-fold nucleotide-binding protein